MTIEAGRVDNFGRPYSILGPEQVRRPYPEVILHTPDFAVLTGSANTQLAHDIGKILRAEIYETTQKFADGEIRTRIPQNIRRRDVFVVQPTSPPVNDSLMELVFMIDAAKRASAKEITAVIPYFGYARQDRKDRSRVPISSAIVAKMIQEAGANRILTLDIHSEQAEGFVSIPWDNIYGSVELVPVLQEQNFDNLVVASPDKGGVARATAFAKRLNAKGIATVFKERDVDVANQSEALDMIGHVDGCDVLVVDDMIDTAGTIVNASELLLSKGAKSVWVAATHGLFSHPALERIENSRIQKVVVTDSVRLEPNVLNSKKIQVVSVAPLLTEAIKRVYVGESLSDLIQ